MILKNWWKEKPYWLKGGIIAFIVLIIIYIILMTVFARWLCEYNDMGNINCSNIQILGTFLFPFSSIPFIELTLVVILITLVIGALIGLVISKIKKVE
jgi:hypothetical protein